MLAADTTGDCRPDPVREPTIMCHTCDYGSMATSTVDDEELLDISEDFAIPTVISSF